MFETALADDLINVLDNVLHLADDSKLDVHLCQADARLRSDIYQQGGGGLQEAQWRISVP